jgi:hypothetical protein
MVTDQQREELRKRLGLIPVIRSSYELCQVIDKDGTKRGAGGLPQHYDSFGRYGHDTIGRVGVRQPKDPAKYGDPATLHMDLDDILRTDPKWGERSLEMMRQVPGLQKAKSHEDVVEALSANIRDTLQTVTPELETLAKSWYPLGNKFNIEEANANGLPSDVMHVVTARLSPQKDWFHNLAMARAFARTYAADPVIDYDAVNIANNIRQASWIDKKNPNIPPPEVLSSSKLVGKRLSDLDDILAGEMVRTLTVLRGENHTINIDGTPVVTPGGQMPGISWQSFDSMGKAMRIIRDPTPQTAHEILGQQHKIRSFYENLRDPHNTSGFDDATIDTHALGMGVGIPWSSSEPMINKFFGQPKSTKAGVSGVYPLFVEANRRVAREDPARFENTNQIQAVTWEGQRALWPRTAKKKWVMESIARIRTREGNGDIGHAEAQGLVEALRVQLPGIATSGAGSGTPAGIKGLPPWVTKGT